LNGGLFEPLYGYNWVETEILLPDTLFANDQPSREKGETGTGILDVFDRYNFTVNEAEPLEKEVAVDPEMLGLVFENLLPEKSGIPAALSTPRASSSTICASRRCCITSAPGWGWRTTKPKPSPRPFPKGKGRIVLSLSTNRGLQFARTRRMFLP
jgi:hypothetical protein